MTIEPVTPDPTIGEDLLAAGRAAYDLDRSHVFHSWSAQAGLKPMTVVKAEGSTVWDGEGRPLIDFSSQMINTNIGHGHPAVVAAIQEQAAAISTIAPAHVNDARSEAARRIAELTPGDLNHVFFTNAGAEAVEHAVRMARLHTGRPKILSAYRSYHGGTDLALNVTGSARRFPIDRASAGTVHFFPPFLYRSSFNAETEEQESQRALEHLERVITLEGPQTVAAVILESVPGTAGIFVPPAGYMEGVRELTVKHGILLIADEVMVGFGRTGTWFGVDQWGVVPDLLTFAKGVNSGYVPLGGVAISDAIVETFAETAYPGGLTYSGHPLACAAAVATLQAMQDEGMVENAARLGTEIFAPRLQELKDRHPSVGDVRGLGAFWAVELVSDRTTKDPLDVGPLVAECKRLGLLPFVAENRLHLAPPLNTPDELVHRGLDILDQALAVADRAVAG